VLAPVVVEHGDRPEVAAVVVAHVAHERPAGAAGADDDDAACARRALTEALEGEQPGLEAQPPDEDGGHDDAQGDHRGGHPAHVDDVGDAQHRAGQHHRADQPRASSTPACCHTRP
jgi:ribosomal protein S12 methylthiotransferase accessory factor YcaO